MNMQFYLQRVEGKEKQLDIKVIATQVEKHINWKLICIGFSWNTSISLPVL